MNFFGYIDPASTALIWQLLAGIFITLGVVFGIWWKKITTFFKTVWVKIFKKKKEEVAEKNANDELALEVEETPKEQTNVNSSEK